MIIKMTIAPTPAIEQKTIQEGVLFKKSDTSFHEMIESSSASMTEP